MNKPDFDYKDHHSPCTICLVKPCCSKTCSEFIMYYVKMKSFVRFKLQKSGIDATTREGYKIYREVMLKFLRESQSKDHVIDVTEFVDNFLYHYEQQEKGD